MRDSMHHRGPDGAGSWHSHDGRIVFGHRRLAIIDLSPGGSQPMTDESGTITITFNGEIYNFCELRDQLRILGSTFRTQSDTEVILEAYKAWGTAFVHHLRGMFAFAIWDGQAGRLLACRDRAGEKPFYYALTERGLWFASELQALLASSRFASRTTPRAVDHYLAHGYPPAGESMLEGIKRLPAGHQLTFAPDARELSTTPFWELPPPPAHPTADLSSLTTELAGLLESAVREQLYADVPVGVLLSGGLDSSLVTAIGASVALGPLRTFTVTFPGEPRFDEAGHARQVASHFGTAHTELELPAPGRDLPGALAQRLGEPFADSSLLPTFLLSQMIRREATVAVGGDGGDELFGGYRHHSLIQRYARGHTLIPDAVGTWFGRAAEAVLPLLVPGRGSVIQAVGGIRTKLAYALLMGPRLRQSLLRDSCGAGSEGGPEEYRLGLLSSRMTPLQQSTRLDFRTYMVDDVLVKVDRASMLASLEVRAPFLDHRIIEFAFGKVPDGAKATTTGRKLLLRSLARRLLPPTLDIQRKQGFSIPLSRWMRGPWREQVADTLTSRSLGEWISPARAGWLLRRMDRGQRVEHQVYALWMLGLWKDRFGVSC